MADDSVTVIGSKSGLFDLKLDEVLKYKDLIILFVKRNYSTRYKQTILGSAWLIINPLCTVIMNTFIFGVLAGLSTDNVPMPLFYLIGNIVWSFFSGCMTDSANTFTGNVGLLGKIYFPRLALPVSAAITQLLDFCIKLFLFVIIYAVYYVSGYALCLSPFIMLLPLVLFQLGLLGTGIGIIISSFTAKYRDLQVLVGFGMAIWMYVTPVVYSITEIPQKWQFVYLLNPVTPGVQIFKYSLLGIGHIPWGAWGIAWGVTIVVIFIGIVIFNKVEKTFMDTV